MSGFTTRTVKLSGATGPAKWAAVVALAMASGAGLTWGLTRRAPEPAAIRGVPPPVVIATPPAPRTVEVTPFAPPARLIGPATPDDAPLPEQQASATESRATQVQEEAAPPPAPQQPAAPRKLNLNTATAAELELLPGIGPAMAKRILDYRASVGRFKSITDLDKVRGIGPKTFEKIRPLVVVE